MSLGMGEVIFIALLAMLVIGPKKLPEIARQVGKAVAEVKRASAGFTEQVTSELRQIESAAPSKSAEECNVDVAIGAMLQTNCATHAEPVEGGESNAHAPEGASTQQQVA